MGTTGQNCLSAELKPPPGTSQAEVAPAWPKSSFFNNIKQVQSTEPDQKMSAWWYKHGETIITPHSGAAGGPDIQVPFHLSATSTDVKIRAGAPLPSLPPGSVLMLSLMWKSHRHMRTSLSQPSISLFQSHFERWHIPSS